MPEDKSKAAIIEKPTEPELTLLLSAIGFKENDIANIYRLAKKRNVTPYIFILQSLALMQSKIEPTEPMNYPGCDITD